MTEFRKSKGREPGTYWPVMQGNVQKATIVCPKCGKRSLLLHGIDADGTVTPSTVCPHDVVECPHKIQCDFHDQARLLDWTPTTDGPRNE